MFITLTEKEVLVAVDEYLAKRFPGYHIKCRNEYMLTASALEYTLTEPVVLQPDVALPAYDAKGADYQTVATPPEPPL